MVGCLGEIQGLRKMQRLGRAWAFAWLLEGGMGLLTKWLSPSVVMKRMRMREQVTVAVLNV